MHKHEQRRIDQRASSVYSVRNALILRPLNRALGYSGHLLLCISGSLLPLAAAHANLGYDCSEKAGIVTCSLSADSPLWGSLTLSNPSEEQQITNTASFNIGGNDVGIQTIYPGSSETMVFGGEPLSGIMVVSQGSSGRDDSDYLDGMDALGAMLTTNGSINLSLADATPSGMVVGVGVSSVGGDGFDQPTHNNNGGSGGNGASTTLFNSSAVTITGGTLNSGVVGALVESRGGKGGRDTSGDLNDNYSGNGGNTQNIEMDNYADVKLGSASTNLQGGTRAWGVAALAVGGDSSYHASGERPMGEGGTAADVTFLSTGNVDVFLTSKTDVPDGVVGLLARSIGGQGGETTWTNDDGGNGGDSGVVSLTAGLTDLSAVTSINVGVDQAVSGTSAGILAQSIGGNGGNQDSNGGYGGNGGNAGSITTDLYWVDLTATGDKVAGVTAYSFGGNGGSDSESSYRANGGNGGTSGTVTVTLHSKGSQDGQQTSISTSGIEAIGVSAQSIGGYGGSAVKQAGVGQNGGIAQITADANSVVSTQGTNSMGMLAQSIGGGGGTGEDFTSSLPGGSGKGGNGGNGANATINSSGTVTTQGQYAHGMVAQSIGGSGGAGAVADSIVSLGGAGGAGGSGRAVTISGTSKVSTSGDSAIGVIAQSIGGGGGTAGSASGLFSVGGSVNNSGSNDADTVTVTIGSVDTTGDGSIGILAQSVGGSGGSGGSGAGITAVGGSGESGGSGGAVTVDPGTNITTLGDYALGVVAQSIGGGGGNGGHSLAISTAIPAVSIGGSAASASSGSKVTIQNSLAGKVSTSGNGSIGILAQSIGGGGGNGGAAKLDSVQSPAAVAIGGTAGGGGNGSEVDINLTNLNLATSGIAAGGIIAQSIGGGGGNGGAAQGFSANIGFSLGVAVGGSGGAGGAGSEVALNLDGVTISTAGVGTNGSNGASNGTSVERSDSYGIVAQSIGGGGGNGGSASAKSIVVPVPVSEDASFAISADVAVGGAGGSGSTGGAVNVQLLDSTAIYTGGQGSHAVIAQSIGGGGGNGGASNAMSTDVSIPSQSVSLNINVAVGGKGGTGGTGGGVTLGMDSAASITTFDDLSNGVLAQSIGGGGGNAGAGSSGSGGVSQGKSYTVLVGVGGSAGTGNKGGAITATTKSGSAITTYGSGSRGMVLHSVGGGGGAAQGTTVDVGLPLSKGGGGGGEEEDEPAQGATTLNASVGVSVGATGGSGGDGGTVTLTSGTTITTAGGDADGVLIQSIGGGGGLGGNAGADASGGPTTYSVPAVPSDDPPSNDPPSNDPPSNDPEDTDLGSYSLSVGVGGTGGASGAGGAVTVNYSGLITTHGDFADGMVVQSIGAGGGAGGAATAKNAKGSSSANISVGGSGGAGGNGGDITLNMFAGPDTSDKFIFTNGDVSYGLLAQSIGGGGGQGGVASDIVTQQSKKDADLVVGLGIGGGGGNAGGGGEIYLNAPNSIVTARTYGRDSHGIVLQSIGGGGGVAAANGLSLGATGIGSLLRLQLGGGGATGNSMGGDIDVNSVVRVQTTGDHAFGLVAQSIGGGGGIVSAGPGANIQSVNIAAPVVGGSLQSGDLNIELAPGSDIDTSGRGAHGIVLQSIAGGGGIGGDTANGPLKTGWADGNANNSPSWNSGDITLTLNDGVATSGAGAHGIIAQSLAAAGGLGGNSQGSFAGALGQSKGGQSGSITMKLNSGVSVSGDNSFAVFAQTYDGSATPAPVDITVSSQVSGQSGLNATGGGIWIDSPATSSVTVTANGVLTGSSAVLQTGTGKTNVTNSGGQIYGNLILGGGSTSGNVGSDGGNAAAMGTLSNDGTFANANLVQGHVVNQGRVLIGKTDGSDTLRVTGDFTQGSQGVLQVATDFVAKTTDLLAVDGHARLDGNVKVVANSLMPNRELTFLQAGTLTHGAAVRGESELFTYRTRQADNSLAVTVDAARFNETSTSYGVGSNLHALGQHLQDIWDRGSNEELGTMYAALNRSAGQGSVSYANALNDLSPGVLAAPAALKQADMMSFSNSLMSCPSYIGTGTQMGERDCVWGRISGNTTQMDGSGGTSGLKSEGVSYQIGAQRSIAPNWFVGVAGAYENKTMRSDDRRQRVEGDTGYLGVSLKHESGPWTFSGALTGSYGSFDNTRSAALMGAQAKSDSHVTAIAQRLRAAYTHAMPRSYIKPFVDLDVIHTRMPSFEERGAGALNLHVEGVSKWSAIVSPGVEVGGRFELDNGYTVRPYASVGVSFSSTGKWDTRARFASAPAGTDPFNSTLDTGRVFGQVSGGVQVLGKKGMDVRLQYDGLLSNKVRSHSGSLKASWKF
ncbi:autotransporter outer membrane beta-barrel domain-containing protein [Pollutimonas subterranea]|nr:autotransporter outer membrane beta-barrel domain-containing protein [Pollutimonas subterranea]